MAGGKGTRISSVASDIPKPMIKIGDKPVLQHQIELFREYGFNKIYISISHLGNVIKDYFGDGSKFGIEIEYLEEKIPMGTAGCLRLLKDKSATYILVNGDIMINFDVDRMLKCHHANGADITLFTHPNSHPFDSALIETADNGRVTAWHNKEDYRSDYKNRVNAGIHIIDMDTIDFSQDIWEKDKVDLDREIIKPNLNSLKVFAYDSPEYVKDMGTPERYMRVCEDYEKGRVSGRNLNKRQRAIFLDRDGTINRHVGFLNKSEQMELLDGAAVAIKKINDSNYLALVVTNQPVIARGECSVEELQKIHNKMEKLLGDCGAYVDDIVYCPHHPDKGFEGEITELKIDCDCRKPKPGMLLSLAEKYNVDLSHSYMIGDGQSDVMAGKNAGCKTVYIGERLWDLDEKPDYITGNLQDAVNLILDREL
ncbi:MAG: HAD-IIIA family hydrolase [Clostridia bacterium]|nr:HAD-IIIA family hydrolase [Clostridia bacterium]